MSFSDHQNSVKSFPQSPWNGISQTLDLKISRGSMPPDPPQQNSRQRRSTRAFGPRFQPPPPIANSFLRACGIHISSVQKYLCMYDYVCMYVM